ncbi:MAG: substrate-binding domain-containing protein [Thioploca sp.]|nr:substrate-binding domain-containing protein [Thioploca sp.]
MNKQVPFINREEELKRIQQGVEKWGARQIIYIHSDQGGIGKTRLLQRLFEIYSKPSPMPSSNTIKKEITVALVLEFSQSEWIQEFVQSVREVANKLKVKLIEKDANFNPQQMEADLKDVVSQSPDAIVVNEGSHECLRGLIEQAVNQGIKVLTFDNDLKFSEPILTTRVSQEEREGVNQSLDRLAADIGYRGEIAVAIGIVKGVEENLAPLKSRRPFLDTALLKYPDISVVKYIGEEIRSNISENVKRETKELIHDYPNIKAIWANGNEFARGIVDTLIETGRTNISVYSFDLCLSDHERIQQPNSPWKAVVATNPVEAGRVMIRLAYQAVQGNKIEPYYSLPITLIAQKSLVDTIKSEKWQDYSEIAWTTGLRKEIKENESLIVSKIIDFDDPSFRSVFNITPKIIEQLDDEDKHYFQSYLDALPNEITASGEISKQTAGKFIGCFNQISAQKRIVLQLDTTDSIINVDRWTQYISNFLLSAENYLLLIAGRRDKALVEEFNEKETQIIKSKPLEIQVIELEPFSEGVSEEYLHRKQELLSIQLEPELTKKLLLLAAGRPILLDLIVEWQARELPLDWLAESSLEQLEQLQKNDKEEFEHRKKELESHLVKRVANTRRSMDWLIIAMTHTYPLKAGTIGKLLGLPIDKAKELFEEAETYSFIKKLPNEYIKLHDNMQDMVSEHVIPTVDPSNARRRHYSRIFLDCLKNEIDKLTTQKEQLEEEKELAKKEENHLKQQDISVKLDSLESEIRVQELQRLHHQCFLDVTEGISIFIKLFDESRNQKFVFEFQESLLKEVERYSLATQSYEVGIRKMDYLQNNSQYQLAKELAEKLLEHKNISLEQQIELRLKLSNALIRLGFSDEAIEKGKEAFHLSQEKNLKDLEVRALNFLGWAYRNQGDYDNALEHYNKAYTLCSELHDQASSEEQQKNWKRKLASIMNNQAYVKALEGNQSIAEQLASEALKWREQIGSVIDVADSYSTLGEIYFMSYRTKDAMVCYDQALEIFTRENHREKIALARCGRALIFLLQEEIDKAEDDLNYAFENGSKNQYPRILHHQARILAKRGDLKGAYKKYEDCRKISQEMKDERYDFKSFADLIDLTWELKAFDKWEGFARELKTKFSKKMDSSLRGSALRKIADLAICDNHYTEALTFYKEGLPLITIYSFRGASSPSSEPFLITKQLESIKKRICACSSPKLLKQLGSDLAQFWSEGTVEIAGKKEKLSEKYHQLIWTFRHWEKEINE